MRLLSVLLLVGMMIGVSSINVVSKRRHQTHALEMVSASADNNNNNDAIVSDARHDLIRTTFCTNWGPVLSRINNGFILMKQSNDANKLMDIFWLTVRQPEVPQCAVRMVPSPGCPGDKVCVVEGAVDALGEAHIHFANYNRGNQAVDLRLSLKDTCVNGDINFHHPDDRYVGRTPASPREPHMKFDYHTKCNRQGDHKYMRETVRGWNAMFAPL